MSENLNYVVIVSLTARPSWLSLSRKERDHVVSSEVKPAVAAHPACTLRWVDAEAFSALCSDIILVETPDLRSWNHLWEELRDSSLFAKPYFDLVSIVPGIVDGYVDYETHVAASGA